MWFDYEREHTLGVADSATGLIQNQDMDKLQGLEVFIPYNTGDLYKFFLPLALGMARYYYQTECDKYEEIFFQVPKMVKIAQILNLPFTN